MATPLAARAQSDVAWELMQSLPALEAENSSVSWTLVPEQQSASDSPSQVAWEVVPQTTSIDAHVANGEKAEQRAVLPSIVVWEVVPEAEVNLRPEEIASTTNKESSDIPKLAVLPLPPPPPRLQSLDRSVAFSDGSFGPDISWNIPNGFRWSERWFGSVSVLGASRRQQDSSFFAWNDGDAVAIVHANLLQAGSWSMGLNTSVRSLYQGDEYSGGSTSIGEGVSSGFRIATQVGDSGGIAFGGEQIVQWDDKTDTGRNFYLMASNGWWLGDHGSDYPLLIANGGFGTGRFANQDILSWDNPLRFACIDNFESREGFYSVDNDLCWSPIGSLSLVFNEWWSTFVEYRSGTAQVATSVNLTSGFPMRFTMGVDFADKNQVRELDQLTWVFRASFGF